MTHLPVRPCKSPDSSGPHCAAMAPEAAGWPTILRSPDLQEKIRDAKVLCVGAGGIGCELLKTLVCTGFQNIEVVDMDTIETSNLNRQFLFRKHHVGKSKAETAAEVVRAFRPSASIKAHHANIKERQFGVDFIKGFSLVLNGLDNLEARRHVNRLAMAAGVPLVESGTAGYLGQVTVHIKGETECFECAPKPTPKTFPICTLRNTPDKPIHCVVWAKDLLFARLFGRPDEVTDLDEESQKKEGEEGAEGESAEEAAAKAAEAKKAREEEASFFLRREGEQRQAYAERIFTRVFHTDIERLVTMESLWKTRPPPKPLSLDAALSAAPSTAPAAETNGQPHSNGHSGAHANGNSSSGQQGGGAELAVDSSEGSACAALGLRDPNQVWSTRDNARVFLQSIITFLTRRASDVGSAVFDKDDDLAVEFVAAASNLRASCFGIPTQSLFAAKGMAGNIIHAIATTNATISGLIAVEALKLLAGTREALRCTYIHDPPSGRRALGPTKAEGPRSGCLACGQAVVTLRADLTSMTLGSLIRDALKRELAVVTPMLTSGSFVYEEGEGLEEDEVAAYKRMLSLPLSKLPGGGLSSGAVVHVDDESQSFKVDMVLVHTTDLEEEKAPLGFILEGAGAAQAAAQAAATSGAEAPSDGTKAAGITQDAATGAGTSTATAAAAALKQQQQWVEDGDGAVVLGDDDDDDVVIVTSTTAATVTVPPSTTAATAAGPSSAPHTTAAGSKRKHAREDGEEEAGEAAGAKRARAPEPAPAAAGAGGGDDDVIEID